MTFLVVTDIPRNVRDWSLTRCALFSVLVLHLKRGARCQTAKYKPPVIVPVPDESDPSPLNWPFSDDEDAGETGVDDDGAEHDSLFDADSLFDEPTCVSVVTQDSSAVVGLNKEAQADSHAEPDCDSHDGSAVVLAQDALAAVQPSTRESLTTSRIAPPISGLHFNPTLQLPREVEESTLAALLSTYFRSPSRSNQIMLFTLPDDTLPPPLDGLLSTVQGVLAPPALSREVHDLLFAPRSDGSTRQAIINHYLPGEGITPHVDLLGRYGDGIVGVSLGSSSAMAFAPVEPETGTAAEVFLPARSIIAMEGAARFSWTHGIPARTFDIVECARSDPDVIQRGTRVSVTFRWMLPGAHIVGLPASNDSPDP